MKYSEKLKVYSNSELFRDIKKRCGKIEQVLETIKGMERKEAYAEMTKASYQRKMIKAALTELIVNRRVKVQLNVKHAIKNVGAWQIEGQRKPVPTIIKSEPITPAVELIKPIESAIDISMIKPIQSLKKTSFNKRGYDMNQLAYDIVAFDLLGNPVKIFKPGKSTWTDVCKFAVGDIPELKETKGVSAKKGNIVAVIDQKPITNGGPGKTVKRSAYGYQWKKLSEVETR